jgi:TP901 family phage tail tape measure protein
MSENLGSAKFQLEIDDKSFASGLKKSEGNAKVFVSQVKAMFAQLASSNLMGESVKNVGTAFKQLDVSVKSTGQVIEKYKFESQEAAQSSQQLRAAQTATAQAATQLKTAQTEATQATTQLRTAQTSTAEATTALREAQTQNTLASARAKEITTQLKVEKQQMAQAVEQTKSKLEAEKSAVEASAAANLKLESAAKSVASAMAHMGAEAAGAALRGLESAANVAINALEKLAKAGAVALAGLTVASVKTAADVEDSVNSIASIAPDIDTSKMFKSLTEISTRVPQSAKEIGDGLYNIYSSFDVTQDQATQAVERFAKGAVGAQTDANTFGTAVMGVLQAYHESIDDADKVSDLFFNTVKAGVVTGPQLAASLGPVTSAAKAAGVSQDELFASIAAVTREGGDASQNINNLNNLYSKFSTKEAQKAMNDLGVKTTDATGKFRPVVDVMSDLKTRLGGFTEAGRAAALQQIFPDAQARQGAQVIMSQLGFVNQQLEVNKTQVGSTEAAYEKMSGGFNAQVKILQNSFSALFATIGEMLLPGLTSIVKAVADGVKSFMAKARRQVSLQPSRG